MPATGRNILSLINKSPFYKHSLVCNLMGQIYWKCMTQNLKGKTGHILLSILKLHLDMINKH